jgi:hypothetical protein
MLKAANNDNITSSFYYHLEIFMKIIFLLFFSYNLIACSSDDVKNSSNIHDVVTYAHCIKLIENDSIIIVSLDKLIFEDNRLFILDRSDSKILTFNDSGKFISKINIDPNISDSAVIYCKSSRFGDTLLSSYQISKLNDFPHKDNYLTPKSFILDMNISDNSISYTARIQTWALTHNPDTNINSKYYVSISLGYVSYNKITHKEKFYPIFDDIEIITQGNTFFFDEDSKHYFIDCYGRRKSGKDWVLATFDSNFNVLEKLLELPKGYVESGCGYFIKFNPYITKINDKIYTAFPFDEKIINPSTRDTIGIPSLSYSNSLIFNKIKNKIIPRDSIHFYLYNEILGLYHNKNNNLITVLRNYYPDSLERRVSHFSVSEMTVKGDLVKNLKINFLNDNGSVRNITFSKQRNSILVSRKSKKGWIIEEIIWN